MRLLVLLSILGYVRTYIVELFSLHVVLVITWLQYVQIWLIYIFSVFYS